MSREDVWWVSFTEESARVFVRSFRCLIDSCSERSSVACCCEAALKKDSADVTESDSLSDGSLKRVVILSINLVETSEARFSSSWSWIKYATERSAVSASHQ
jgi:hypothetical protein